MHTFFWKIGDKGQPSHDTRWWWHHCRWRNTFPHLTQKRSMMYVVGNLMYGMGQAQKCCGVKPDDGQMGFQLSPFDNHPDLNKNKFYMKFN